METIPEQITQERRINVQPQQENYGWLALSGILLSISLIFALMGIFRLNNITNAPEYVGGDAYNFIIHTNTINGYILLSIACAAMAATSALYAIFVRLKR